MRTIIFGERTGCSNKWDNHRLVLSITYIGHQVFLVFDEGIYKKLIANDWESMLIDAEITVEMSGEICVDSVEEIA